MDSGATTRILATRSGELSESVTATGLALGVEIEVVTEVARLRQVWSSAELVLVGTDFARRAQGLPPRPQATFVTGIEAAAVAAASAELGVPALPLPGAVTKLADALAVANRPRTPSEIIVLVGASGGLGVSSLTVGLAGRAAATGATVAAVELADCGPGLDLLFGCESRAGLNWDDLAQASGELGAIDDQLLRADGVSVVALGRRQAVQPDPSAVMSVMRALARSHRWLICDGGTRVPPALQHRGRVVLLVGADVSSVASARVLASRDDIAGASLMVRTGAGRGLPAAEVARALGLPLLGVLRHDPSVPRLASEGISIAAAPARRFRRDVKALWQALQS